MKFLVAFLLSLPLFSDSSFISPMEYASQLYKNPRGIGCHNCHGEQGEGRLVAKYTHKKTEKEFRGPNIAGSSFKEFFKGMNRGNKGMPRYYLTRKEIRALYQYVNQKREDDK